MRCVVLVVVSIFAAVLAGAVRGRRHARRGWTRGPASVDLGADVARSTSAPATPLRARRTRGRSSRRWATPSDNTEVGMVTPTAEDQDWMVIFEYEDGGLRQGRRQGRDRQGRDPRELPEGHRGGQQGAARSGASPRLHVTGWFEEPHYDARHPQPGLGPAREGRRRRRGGELQRAPARPRGLHVGDPGGRAREAGRLQAARRAAALQLRVQEGQDLRGVGPRRQGGGVRAGRAGRGRRGRGGGQARPVRRRSRR